MALSLTLPSSNLKLLNGSFHTLEVAPYLLIDSFGKIKQNFRVSISQRSSTTVSFETKPSVRWIYYRERFPICLSSRSRCCVHLKNIWHTTKWLNCQKIPVMVTFLDGDSFHAFWVNCNFFLIFIFRTTVSFETKPSVRWIYYRERFPICFALLARVTWRNQRLNELIVC